MQGELQYFIGVQLDGSEYLEPERRRLSEKTEKEGAKVVQETANNIDGAVRELPDANMVWISNHPLHFLSNLLFLVQLLSPFCTQLTGLCAVREKETGRLVVKTFITSAPKAAQHKLPLVGSHSKVQEERSDSGLEGFSSN